MSILHSSLKVATTLKSIEDSTIMERILSRFSEAWVMDRDEGTVNLEIEYLDRADMVFCLSLPGIDQIFVNDDQKISIQVLGDLG